MSRVVMLTRGVGGAKLVLGLCHAVPARDVTAIVNSGDDFEHLGLFVSPDVDTLLYTLSGKANVAQGWGRENETRSFMAALRSLGAEDWFNLGDGDLALHLLRTRALAGGGTLSAFTAAVAKAWRIEAAVLPMSDDPVSTMLETEEGTLAFQANFVRRRCEPVVGAIRFDGVEAAQPAPDAQSAIARADAILVARSNPFLSVDPILAVPGIRAALAAAPAPVIAVSPIVGGQAVKEPTAKLMRELGVAVDAATVARHYEGVIDGLLVDERDPPASLPIPARRADTLMTTLDDRVRVARAALDFTAATGG